jgi:hypothetical protein
MPPFEDESATGTARRFHDKYVTVRLRRSLQVLQVTDDVPLLYPRPR